MSLKWDGAPSVVIGHDWVALKSSWKTKRYKNSDEIAASDLKDRVKDILSSIVSYVLLEKRIAPGVIVQADVVAHRSMILKSYQSRYLFQANTLIYEFPSMQYLTLVVHSIEMESGFDIPWEAIKQGGTAKFIDPNRSFLPETFDALKMIDRYDIDERVMQAIVRYRNYATKANLPIYRLERDTFEWFIKDTIITQGKSILNPGRVGRTTEWNDLLDWSKTVDFERLYGYTLAVLQHKHHILRNNMNQLGLQPIVKCFVETDRGDLLPTTHEGLVLKGSGRAVKLVDRNEFSTYNFSKHITKGFDR